MIKIVIVEDLPIVLEGIKILINHIADFEVVGFYDNGQKFIDNIKDLECDVVLMDIDMPVVDGIIATKYALGLIPSLKVIALSLHNESKFYYEMITSGAKGFVLKQASSQDLEVAIREVYSGGNYFSPELLHGVILGMQNIEQAIIDEKKELFQLSEREEKMLKLLCKGLSNKELSDQLCVSVRTVESSKAKLMQKTNTKNTAGLIIWAIKNKVVVV